jgi:hypothetical protein
MRERFALQVVLLEDPRYEGVRFAGAVEEFAATMQV